MFNKKKFPIIKIKIIIMNILTNHENQPEINDKKMTFT